MTERADLSPAAMRAITQARLTHGVRGRAAPTAEALRFALDHARAREAVLSELDVPALARTLHASDLASCALTSAAESRDVFIRRPDLGRRLPEEAARSLAAHGPCDVALVLGDGLSAIAAMLNGPAFLYALHRGLTARGLRPGPIVLARQARVALGDGVARALGARTVVMALGERPGLSAADGLGVYITHRAEGFAPEAVPDSARNCLSNVRDAGLQVAEAAAQAERLIAAMRASGQSGVALSRALATGRDVLPGTR